MHSVVGILNGNDYGKDLLRQPYQQHRALISREADLKEVRLYLHVEVECGQAGQAADGPRKGSNPPLCSNSTSVRDPDFQPERRGRRAHMEGRGLCRLETA